MPPTSSPASWGVSCFILPARVCVRVLLCRRFSLSQAEHPQPLRTALQAKYPDHRHVFVPLINVSPDPPLPGSRGDLQLRLDAMRILEELLVEPEQLVYAKGTGQLSCVGKLQALHDTGQLRLILVDHNEYTGGCVHELRFCNNVSTCRPCIQPSHGAAGTYLLETAARAPLSAILSDDWSACVRACTCTLACRGHGFFLRRLRGGDLRPPQGLRAARWHGAAGLPNHPAHRQHVHAGGPEHGGVLCGIEGASE